MSCYGTNGFDMVPYPSTERIQPDKKMAKALCDSYVGEMSTINSYIYYSVMFADTLPEFSDMFEHLAEIEMIHFRLISECIQKLGVNPAFNLRLSNSPLREGENCAPIEAERCIERSIQDECAASEEYRRLAAFTCDSALRDVLERLASDEENHRRTLEDFCI